jgi:hypothetical protein
VSAHCLLIATQWLVSIWFGFRESWKNSGGISRFG